MSILARQPLVILIAPVLALDCQTVNTGASALGNFNGDRHNTTEDSQTKIPAPGEDDEFLPLALRLSKARQKALGARYLLNTFQSLGRRG